MLNLVLIETIFRLFCSFLYDISHQWARPGWRIIDSSQNAKDVELEAETCNLGSRDYTLCACQVSCQ